MLFKHIKISKKEQSDNIKSGHDFDLEITNANNPDCTMSPPSQWRGEGAIEGKSRLSMYLLGPPQAGNFVVDNQML